MSTDEGVPLEEALPLVVPKLIAMDVELVQPIADFLRTLIATGRKHDVNPTFVVAWSVAKCLVAIRRNVDEDALRVTVDVLWRAVLDSIGKPGTVSIPIKENPDPKEAS